MELYFEDRGSWRRWLKEHHGTVREVWLVFFKKHTGKPGIAYDAAVEEALCYGWIDSIIKRLDDERYARKFTPRTNIRKWSAANLKRVQELIASGRMTEVGLAKVPSDIEPQPPIAARPLSVPKFFAEALAEHPVAKRFFDQLAPSYKRAYIGWVGAAKREETQRRHLDEAIALLEKGKKLGLK
ncbi:YdeI family protein [Candidatus Neomarinimicrobiota bacterium]